MLTSQVLGTATPDSRWREFHVGSWEGLTSDEIRARHPGQFEALMNGEDIELGGGERLSDFNTRVVDAYSDLLDEMEDGQEAVVVTHGGVIWAVATHVLGRTGRSRALSVSHNTAVTKVRVDGHGEGQLAVFNDASHLDDVPVQFGPNGSVVTLFRHGQSEGNVLGRWQGRSDSPLTEYGLWQAETASTIAPSFGALFTSPLGRTVETAEIIGRQQNVTPTLHDGLVEMSFGSWENLTSDEASELDPDLFEAIYGRGEDEPRGRDGESFGEAGERMVQTLSDLTETTGSPEIGVISHGAAIRAYATRVAGLTFAERNRIPVPRNSSMSRVVYSGRVPVISSYNVAPHLD
jgi:probable phosphoglycerate mutase